MSINLRVILRRTSGNSSGIFIGKERAGNRKILVNRYNGGINYRGNGSCILTSVKPNYFDIKF